MDNWVNEKINKIKDLDERAMLKRVMISIFDSIQEYTDKKYLDIENRVFNEVDIVREKYNIFSTICRLQDLDPINEFLFPILKEDIEEKVYEAKKILEALENRSEINIFKVFMKLDYLEIEELLNNEIIFNGNIITKDNKFKAQFKLKRNKEYIKKLEELYKSTINNNIPWKTKNMPYINKMMNVVLVGAEAFIGADTEIESIDVDFGRYSEVIEYNMVPLWNIKEVELRTNGFPTPCVDKVSYEHNVSLEKEGLNHGYIVKFENLELERNTVIFNKDFIKILSNSKESKKWGLYKFINKSENDINVYDYEMMTNEINTNFASKLAMQTAYTIKTKTELERIISSFKISSYLKFVDLKIEDFDKKKLKETYEVNNFIKDEIREGNIKKTLVLMFSATDVNYYLNRDILSFIVSEIQFLYPEYDCEGKLV